MSRIIDSTLLDATTSAALASPRRRRNHNFHAEESEPCNRLLNAIEPGSYVAPHRHADPHKSESLIILRGRLGAVFFDEMGEVTETALLTPGGAQLGVNVPCGVFHTCLALESGTVFFEAKAGPYRPLAAEERASWAPAEGASGAAAYLASLEALFR